MANKSRKFFGFFFEKFSKCRFCLILLLKQIEPAHNQYRLTQEDVFSKFMKVSFSYDHWSLRKWRIKFATFLGYPRKFSKWRFCLILLLKQIEPAHNQYRLTQEDVFSKFMKVSLSYNHWSLRKWRKNWKNFEVFLRKIVLKVDFAQFYYLNETNRLIISTDWCKRMSSLSSWKFHYPTIIGRWEIAKVNWKSFWVFSEKIF